MRKHLSDVDDLLNMARVLSGEDLDLPLVSTINEELGEFLKRFRPMICRAGYCCLKIKHNPDAWSKYVFQLRVERIRKPPKNSKVWERYKVVSGEALSIAGLLKEHDGFKALMPQFERYHEENVRVGCIGTVTTFLVCDSAKLGDDHDVRCVSWGGYGEDAWDDVFPGEDWLETLKEEVEKMAGRAK